jgi:hypothetical protein
VCGQSLKEKETYALGLLASVYLAQNVGSNVSKDTNMNLQKLQRGSPPTRNKFGRCYVSSEERKINKARLSIT